MYRNTVPTRQLSTWLCTALIPVTVHLAANMGWLLAVITAVVCGGAVAAVWKWGRWPQNAVVSGAQYLIIIGILLCLLPQSALCWPGDNFPAVPLILLVLAAWSAHKGAAAAARVGCVLFWLVLLIYICISAAGISEIEWGWLRPEISASPQMAVVLLLIPCATMILRKEKCQWSTRLVVPGLFLTVAAVIAAGMLSGKLATKLEDPFYCAVRGLNILGMAQHFEAVLSAAMTAGWFALLSVLLCAAEAYAEQFRPQLRGKTVWISAGIGALGVLCKLHINWWLAVILASVFWVVIPLLTQGLVDRKK